MKKLIMALGVAALAATVQAASFTWTSANWSFFADSSGAATTTTTAYSTALNGGSVVLVYLGTTASYSWDNAQVLNGGDANYTGSTGALQTSGAARNKGKVYGSFSWKYDDTEGAENLVKNGSVFGVMYQDKDGALSKLFYIDKDGNKGADITTIYTVSGITDNTSSSDTFTFTTAGTSATSMNNFTAVPEPTSGLLMLLGMAGLALRRRRA